jgi:hypothetical protein
METMTEDPIRQASIDGAKEANRIMRETPEDELAKFLPEAVKSMIPVERELMKRKIHQGADPLRESLRAIFIYLAKRESNRIMKERGLK